VKVFLAPGWRSDPKRLDPWLEGLRRRGFDAEGVGLPMGRAERSGGPLMAVASPDAVVGGMSFGGRVASLVAAETTVAGLLCMSFPLAGAGEARYGRRTRCNVLLEPGTIGITDSVLPCGILVYVSYQDSPHILTRVIDRRPVVPGRKFDLTPKLAEELGVDGVQRIRWVFAR